MYLFTNSSACFTSILYLNSQVHRVLHKIFRLSWHYSDMKVSCITSRGQRKAPKLLAMVKCKISLLFHHIFGMMSLLGDFNIVTNHVAIKISMTWTNQLGRMTVGPCGSLIRVLWSVLGHNCSFRSGDCRFESCHGILPWPIQGTFLTWSNTLLWEENMKNGFKEIFN